MIYYLLLPTTTLTNSMACYSFRYYIIAELLFFLASQCALYFIIHVDWIIVSSNSITCRWSLIYDYVHPTDLYLITSLKLCQLIYIYSTIISWNIFTTYRYFYCTFLYSHFLNLICTFCIYHKCSHFEATVDFCTIHRQTSNLLL